MRKILVFGALFFVAQAAMADARLENAQALGWIAAPGVCGGHFAEPPLPGENSVLPPITDAPVTITANSSQLKYTGVSTLSGDVVMTQPGRLVSASEAHLTTQNGDYKTADLQGNVTVREKGKMAIGHNAQFNLQGKRYTIEHVIYRLLVGSYLSAWGKASHVTEPPSGITELKDVTYSTCPPKSRAWDMKASRLILDRASGRGTAYNAFLYTHGVPFLYMPYFNFPIDNRRQTGFLYPQFSFGGSSGLGIGTPFYWNIAPNHDDTITPTFYVKRGFMFNNLYRYLSETSTGNINLTVLPNDWAFRKFQKSEYTQVPVGTPGLNALANATPTRSNVSWLDQTRWNKQWTGSINYSRVSDDYYPTDIGNVPQVAQNQLLQQGQVTYAANDWQFLGNFQAYQTLHPVNQALVLNQYSMLPQLLFSSNLPGKANHLTPSWLVELVNFTAAPNPGQTIPPPSGQRINVIPGLGLPLSNAEGYVTPALQFEMTQYNLGDQPTGLPDEITRTVPIFNIDSGLFFERGTHFFGQNYEQTLEPRLFYLYVPYHDQHDIPVFDSSIQPFTFNQLFLTNRFSGSDRIGDANQLSAAVTTRFMDKKTGDEKFSAGVGIISYFEDRRVTLCQTAGCMDPLYSAGSTSPTESTSPIVGQATYHFNPVWSLSGGSAWDPTIGQTQNANVNFQYNPAVNHIVNVGYNYVRYGDYFLLPGQTSQLNNNPTTLSSKFNLSEPTVSFAWPLNDHWSVVGSWSYSWNQEHSLTYFSGVQYNTCCWATQLVLARTYTGLNAFAQPQFDTGVYLQWAFKGLAKVAGNDPTSLLLSSIPGYQDNFAAT